MVVVNFESPIEFVIDEVFTYGVENSKYGGYNLPLKLEPEDKVLELLKSKAEENKAVLKLYGADKTTIYIRFDQLTDKQREELLNKGKMIVLVEFSITGTYPGKDGSQP